MSLDVKADVYDARMHTPQAGEVFLVDTNVWVWLSYQKASLSGQQYQARSYPSFVARARKAGATLARCGLSLSELANTIEREEFRQYASMAGLAETSKARKEFRRNAAERLKVVTEFKTAWAQVEALSDFIPAAIDSSTTEACLKRLLVEPIDPYDGFLVESAVKANIPQILTDDADFAVIAGVKIFTCNNAALAAAKGAGRLRN